MTLDPREHSAISFEAYHWEMIIYDLSLGLLHVSEHFWMFLVWISRKSRNPGHLVRAWRIGVFDFGMGRVHPWAILLRADYTSKYDNDQIMENDIHKWYCGDRASQNQFGYKIPLHFWKETLSGPPTPWHHLCSWLGTWGGSGEVGRRRSKRSCMR